MPGIRIAFFDLDGTLCPVGEPSAFATVALMRKLSQSGVRIAVCSGKPVAYLNGYARQLGIHDIIMIGETGAVWQNGMGLPPEGDGHLPVTEKAASSLGLIREEFARLFAGKYWLQPNTVEYTVFPYKNEYFPEMTAYFNRVIPGSGLDIYCQPDCFDILPHGIDKGAALRAVCGSLCISPDDACAVGDGINDIPMFAAAGHRIGVGVKYDFPGFVTVDTPEDAIGIILENHLNNTKGQQINE